MRKWRSVLLCVAGVLYEAGASSPYEAIYFARLRRKDLK